MMREPERKPSVPILLIVAGAFFVVVTVFFKGTHHTIFMYLSALIAITLVGAGVIELIRKYRRR